MTANDPPTAGPDNTVARWLRENAAHLRTLDPSDEDVSDLEPLREIVGDARVVAIGESTHRMHEFYQVRHRLVRFLVAEMGFTAFVMESGFPEGLAVDAWVRGGHGNLADLLHSGITYHMGKCDEMRDQLAWMRSYNASHDRAVGFYGVDLPDSSASALPAVEASLKFLNEVDPAYAEALRRSLLPLFGYLPTDRTGLAWAAPTLHAYLALDPAARNELTARIGDLAERMQAQRVVYAGRADTERFERAYRCACTARHMDAFLQAMAAGAERTYEGANIRDAAMAENIEWILRHEERVVISAANGHVQRWPFSAPPIVNDRLTTVGQHLAASLGDRMVVIGSTLGGGELFLHRPIPGAPAGHTETFVEDMPTLDPDSLDALLATAGLPHYLLDLRKVPGSGAVVERFATRTSLMTGGQATPVDVMAAFDAVVHVDRVTPWHTFLGAPM
ncbi:MAG: erythromycin esterase family protein [Actinopolymorphaceae bacterium]